MFQGRVNVKPVVESMLPEGRGEKQRRLDFWLSAQVITPERYLELYNHPHMGRAAKPGGVHGEMAEWENGQLMQGNLLYPIEPHDDEIHLLIHETFMAAPEFLELGPEVRTLFYNHVDALRNLIQQKALRDAALMAQVAGPAGQMESMAQVQATAPLALAAGAENEGNSEEADTG